MLGQRLVRVAIILLMSAVIAACSGGGGEMDGNNDGGNGGNNNNGVTGACSGTGSVTISGLVEYAFVPAVIADNNTNARLDYSASEFRPVRGATVHARCPDGSVTYASTATGQDGRYSLTVPENVDVVIRVRAEMQQSGTPGWNVQVVDNTRNQGLWALDGQAFSSGTGSAEVNLRASSGWSGSGYSGERAAAPFAILDSVHVAMQKVLAVDTAAVFPPLKLNWSPANTDACSSDMNAFPFDDGCIGTSFFANFGGSAGRNIFILGAENRDTDEYDRHVVIHEWGHYYETAFSRSDSIGGRHGFNDKLDMRVAFGEGWGNAWSAIATDDPLYIDTSGSQQASGFYIDIENDAGHPQDVNPGWWNETTVQSVIYKLYAPAYLGLGFDPLHDVLTNGQRSTEAMTSIFSLIHFLKGNVGATRAADIDALLARREHGISEVEDEWGSGRDVVMDDGSEFVPTIPSANYVSPVHIPDGSNFMFNGSNDLSICTTEALAGNNGEFTSYNRLGGRRFVRFEVAASGSWKITLNGSGKGRDSDPDFYVYREGTVIAAGLDYSGDGSTDVPDGNTRAETENVTFQAGQTYVIEAMDWFNVDDDSSTGGDICLDLGFEALP